MNNQIIAIIASLAMAMAIVLLGKYSNMLKDTSTAKKMPYSFSRVQLAWWTVIIIGSFIYIILSKTDWTKCGSVNCDIISNTALILLGIGASTTVAGRIIDNSQSTSNRIQDEESEGFVRDILSDANGVSIHRFQNFIFNLIFGIMFIIKVYNCVQAPGTCVTMPDFSNTELALMGLSSATYATLKIGENPGTDQTQG